MAFDIRETRLRNDYGRIRELVDRSEFINIVATEGEPVEKYLIRFSCRGVEKVTPSGKPVYRDTHDVSIYLHSEYPLKAAPVEMVDAHLPPQYPCDRRGLYWRLVAGENA